MNAAVLDAVGVVAGYEPGAPIVNGASIAVDAGRIVTLLGPNGAGKSTLVRAIAGLVPYCTGQLRVGGIDLLPLPAHRRIAAGLAYVPQLDNVFATLSVADNLALAVRGSAAARRAAIERGLERFPELAGARRRAAGRLSGGQRQMLAIARALLVEPRVLVLDEPSAGLAPKVVGEVFSRLRAFADSGVAIVLVEQNVRAALAIADEAIVLVQGRNRLQGRAADVGADPALAALYVGGVAA